MFSHWTLVLFHMHKSQGEVDMTENYVQWYAGDIFELSLGQEIGTSDLTLMSLLHDDDWMWTCLIKDHRATCDHLCTHVHNMISGWYTFSCQCIHLRCLTLKICRNCDVADLLGFLILCIQIQSCMYIIMLYTSLFVSCQWYYPMCKHTSCAIIPGLDQTSMQHSEHAEGTLSQGICHHINHAIKSRSTCYDSYLPLDQINPKFAPLTTFSLLFF